VIIDRLTVIRSRIIEVMTSMSRDELLTSQGKLKLLQEIHRVTINEGAKYGLDEKNILGVHFSSLIVQ